MPDATLLAARDVALDTFGVSATFVPLSGTGPVTVRGVLRPERDEVAEFPELRGVLGAERPAWAFAIAFEDCPGRPVAGDRVTILDFGTLQLRGVKSDPHALWFLTSGFLVESEDTEPDTLEPGIYMPAGLGFSTAESLL